MRCAESDRRRRPRLLHSARQNSQGGRTTTQVQAAVSQTSMLPSLRAAATTEPSGHGSTATTGRGSHGTAEHRCSATWLETTLASVSDASPPPEARRLRFPAAGIASNGPRGLRAYSAGWKDRNSKSAQYMKRRAALKLASACACFVIAALGREVPARSPTATALDVPLCCCPSVRLSLPQSNWGHCE